MWSTSSRPVAGPSQPEGDDVDSAYLPAFSRADLIGITIAIVGTITAALLAAAAATGSGPDSGWKAVAILVAIGIALVNLAHVVGLTFFESGALPRWLREAVPDPLDGRDPACRFDQPGDPPLQLETVSGPSSLVAKRLQNLLGQLRAVLGPQRRGVDPQHDAVLVDFLE